MKTYYFIILLLVTILFIGCEKEQSEFDKQVEKNDNELADFLDGANSDIQFSTEGYYFQPLIKNEEGEEISHKDIIEFYYSMTLLDGTELPGYMDTTKPPLLFKKGGMSIIPEALDYGAGLMRTGETYRFYIPSYLAFFDYGHSDYFPEFSNLVVDMYISGTLSEAEVQQREEDSIQAYLTLTNSMDAKNYATGLIYLENKKGDGAMPVTGDYVSILFTSKYLDGTIIRSEKANPMKFYLGTDRATEGLQDGIRLMKNGGKATLIMPSRIAFGKSLQAIPLGIRTELYDDQWLRYDVDPYSPIIYEVELVNFWR